jgi:hypothetical protein
VFALRNRARVAALWADHFSTLLAPPFTLMNMTQDGSFTVDLTTSTSSAHSDDLVFQELFSQFTCGGPLTVMLCEGCRGAFQPVSDLLLLASTLYLKRVEPVQRQAGGHKYIVYQLIIHSISLVSCECIVGLTQEKYVLEQTVLKH